MLIILLFLLLLLLTQPQSFLFTQLCELCFKASFPSCFENGILTNLARNYKAKNVSHVYVLLSTQISTEKCKVDVTWNQTHNVSREWKLEPYSLFPNIFHPHYVYLKRDSFTHFPQEGLYTIFFLNHHLSFHVFDSNINPNNSFVTTFSKTSFKTTVSQRFERCLNFSSSPTVFTECEYCQGTNIDFSIRENQLSLRLLSLPSNRSSLSFSLHCLLDAKVLSGGHNQIIKMYFRYDKPPEYSLFSSLSFYTIFPCSLLLISLLCSLCFFLVVYYRKKTSIEQRSEKTRRSLFKREKFPSWATHRFVDLGSLEIGEFLGGGQFGSVYSGRLRDEPHRIWDVAIKRPNEGSEQSLLVKEGEIMVRVGYHNHIVNLQSVSWSQNFDFCLILEICHNGNLESLLQRDKELFKALNDNYISSSDIHSLNYLLSWSKDISDGMAFLDSKNIIHGDLAARNILMSLQWTAKISDFGLSHKLYESPYGQLNNQKLPICWMGPETLKNGRITKKSDVWAFGVLLWEIFTFGDKPYDGFPSSVIYERVYNGFHLSNPEHCPSSVRQVMTSCWNLEPENRPSFDELFLIFDSLITNRFFREMKQENINVLQKCFFENPLYKGRQ